MSETRTIFGFWAMTDYEGSTLIRAYADEAKARAVCTTATEYHSTRPNLSDYGDTDADFDKFDSAMKEWLDKHPGGKHASCADSFGVFPAELIE